MVSVEAAAAAAAEEEAAVAAVAATAAAAVASMTRTCALEAAQGVVQAAGYCGGQRC